LKCWIGRGKKEFLVLLISNDEWHFGVLPGSNEKVGGLGKYYSIRTGKVGECD